MQEPTKEALLKEYADKEVGHFVQYDGWAEDTGASSQRSRCWALFPRGYDLFYQESYDLRRSPEALAVRVQIAYGANRAQVVYLLSRILAMLLKDADQEQIIFQDYIAQVLAALDAQE